MSPDFLLPRVPADATRNRALYDLLKVQEQARQAGAGTMGVPSGLQEEPRWAKAARLGAEVLPPVSVPEIVEGVKKAARGDYAGGAKQVGAEFALAGTTAGLAHKLDAARQLAKIAGLGDNAAGEGIRAWHGSPYRGTEQTGFDLSKVGTGEGAQAYGHGFYFAQSRKLGEWYRDILSKSGPGGLYEVLLQTTPDKLMTWEEPLADQSPEILRAVNAAKTKLFRPLETRTRRELANILQHVDHEGEWLTTPMLSKDELLEAAREMEIEDYLREPIEPSRTGLSAYQQLAAAGGGGGKNKGVGQRAASAALNESGVPGIKYWDFSSRSSTVRPPSSVAGTRNYVIFDPQTIKILQALGLAAMTGGSAAALAKPKKNEPPSGI